MVPVPPFESKITVTSVCVHCAYKTIEDAEIGIVFEVLAAKDVPEPFAKVFQPVNV